MRTFVLVVLLATAALARGATAPPLLLLSISGSRITASGVTAKSSVFSFCVVHERQRFTPVVKRMEQIVADDDGDGTVVFDYGRPVPTE